MSVDNRCRNWTWTVTERTYEAAQLAVLMDIREQLQALNTLLRCPNFMQIPMKIEAIRKNTAKPKRKRKRK